MEWLEGLDYTKHLTGDLRDVADIVGLENLVRLIDRFDKTPVFFSARHLLSLKTEYIRKMRGKVEPRVLARQLRVGERFVYDVYKQMDFKDNQITLEL